jgi:tetratricopeptide (TPR) repeat protein
MADDTWEHRVAAHWQTLDDVGPETFVAGMRTLAAERPGDAVASYELGGALDSTGSEDEAAEHYRRAFDAGLPAALLRPATIQYASTLRNLGRADEAVLLLTAERARASDELDDAVRAFLALALVDAGRPVEATGVALGALAPHLSRYTRSLAAYAAVLRNGAP